MGKYGGKVSLLALMSFALTLTCTVNAFVAQGLDRANNGNTQPNTSQQGLQDNSNGRSTGNNAIGSSTQGSNNNGEGPFNPRSNARSYNRKYSRQKRHMAIDVAQHRFRRQVAPTDPPISWNFHPDTRKPAASQSAVGSNSPIVIAGAPPSDPVRSAQPSQSVSWNFRFGNREPVSRGDSAANANSPVVIASVPEQGLQPLGSAAMTDSPVHVLGDPPYHVSAADQPTWLSSKHQNTIQTAPSMPKRIVVNPDVQPLNTMQDSHIIETLSPMKDKTKRTIDSFFPQMTQPSPNRDSLVSNGGATQAHADIGAPTVNTPVHTKHHGHREHVPSSSSPADGIDITNSLHGTGSHTSGFHPQSQISFKLPGGPMPHPEKTGHQQHGAMNHVQSAYPIQVEKPSSHHQHMGDTNRLQSKIPSTPPVPTTTPDLLPTTASHRHGNGMRMHRASENVKPAQQKRRNLPPTKIKHRARGDDRRDKRRRKTTRIVRRLPQSTSSGTKGQLGLSISPQLMNLPPPVADLFPPNLLPLNEQQGLPDAVQGQSSVTDTMIETGFQRQTINPLLQAQASFDIMKSVPSQNVPAAEGDIYQRIQGLTIKDLAKSNFTTDQIIKALALNIKSPDVTDSQSSNRNQPSMMGTENNAQSRQGLDNTFRNNALVSSGDQPLSHQDGSSGRQQTLDMHSTPASSNQFGDAQGRTGPQQNHFDSQHHSSSRQNDRNGRPSWDTRRETQAPRQNTQQTTMPNNRPSNNVPLKRMEKTKKFPMKSIKGVSVQRWFFPGMADIFSSIVSTSPEPSTMQSFQPVYQAADTIPPTTQPPMEYPTPPVERLPASSIPRATPPVQKGPQPPVVRSSTPVQRHKQPPVARPTPPVQIQKRPQSPVQRPTPPLPTAPVAHVTPPVKQRPSVPKARPTPLARRGPRPPTARPKRPIHRRQRPPAARPKPQATRPRPQAPRPRPSVQQRHGRPTAGPQQPPTQPSASGQRIPSRNGRRPSGKGRAARPQVPRGRVSTTGRRPSHRPFDVDATLNMTNTKNIATTKNESKLKRRKLNITRETRIINRPIGPPVNTKTDALLTQIVKELKQPSGTPSPVNQAIETKLGQILELLKSNSNSQPTGTTAPPFDIMQLLALQQMGDIQPMPPMMGMMPLMQSQMGSMMPPMVPTTPSEPSSKPSNAGQLNPIAMMMMNSMLQGNGSQPAAPAGGNMGMSQLFPDLAAMGGLMPGQNSTAATGQGGFSAPMMQMLMAQFAQSNNENNNNNNQCRCYPKLLGCPNDTILRNGRGAQVKCKKTEIRCCDDN